MIGVIGGAELILEEEAILMSCRYSVGANHHRVNQHWPVDFSVTHAARESTQIPKAEPRHRTVFDREKVKVSTFSPYAGYRAVCWALREFPEEKIYVCCMDLYLKREPDLEYNSGHDRHLHARLFIELLKAHKPHLIYAERFINSIRVLMKKDNPQLDLP